MTIRPFNTPLNERSFSGLIDRCVLETGKTQALLSAIQYANLTIRECQSLGLFAQDSVEDQVLATTAPFTWTRPNNLRSLRVVQYNTSKTYPKFRLPGRGKNRTEDSFFYASSGYFMFQGVIANELINYMAYMWCKPLVYAAFLGAVTTSYPGGPYPVREAYYNTTDETWYYLNDDADAYVTTISDTAEELLRRNSAAHWLILDWFDLVLEGTKAKLFKQYNDERAIASYALYKQGQKILQNTSGAEVESFEVVDNQ
jgi:hypothetical protein